MAVHRFSTGAVMQSKEELDEFMENLVKTCLSVFPGAVALELGKLTDGVIFFDGGMTETPADGAAETLTECLGVRSSDELLRELEGETSGDTGEEGSDVLLIPAADNGIISQLLEHYKAHFKGCQSDVCITCSIRKWLRERGYVEIDHTATVDYLELLHQVENVGQLQDLNSLEVWVPAEDVAAVMAEGSPAGG